MCYNEGAMKEHPVFHNYIFFSVLGILIFALIALLLIQTYNLGRIIKGISVAEIKVSHLGPAEAEKKLQEEVRNFSLKFKYKDEAWLAAPEELGVNLLIKESITNAYSLGRDDNLAASLLDEIFYFFKTQDLDVAYNLDKKQFKQYFKNNFASIENPYQETILVFEKDAFKIKEGKVGIVIDKLRLRSEIDNRLRNLETSPIQLILKKRGPSVKKENTENAKRKADKLIEKGIRLIYKDNTWPLEKETLAGWLKFHPSWNSQRDEFVLKSFWSNDAIEDYLVSVLTPAVNRKPVNARFLMREGKVKTFTLSQKGLFLDIEASKRKIIDELKKDSRKINLIVKETPPAITTDDIDTLGIDTLLARGKSDFGGSPDSRSHNIKVGTAIYNGILVAPEEELSFNEILGPVGPKQGYLPELVIKNGKTIPEYGGGLCQVSTTLFRAATKAGLDITKRYNHSYVVDYYGKPGFDATIYPPNPDLRFKNSTPNHILIQGKIEGTKLYFEIYGTDDGRTTKLEGPVILERRPNGAIKTLLTRKIYKNGKIISEDKFYSNYKSPSLYPIIRNPLE